jgi:hypothetical protein
MPNVGDEIGVSRDMVKSPFEFDVPGERHPRLRRSLRRVENYELDYSGQHPSSGETPILRAIFDWARHQVFGERVQAAPTAESHGTAGAARPRRATGAGRSMTRDVTGLRHAVRQAAGAVRHGLTEGASLLVDGGSASDLHSGPPAMGILDGVPTHDSLVAILAEISERHEDFHVSRHGGRFAYCHCGEHLLRGRDVLGIHRAHVAEIQASAIAEAIQVARNTP